jgi:hypothetical protein
MTDRPSKRWPILDLTPVFDREPYLIKEIFRVKLDLNQYLSVLDYRLGLPYI